MVAITFGTLSAASALTGYLTRKRNDDGPTAAGDAEADRPPALPFGLAIWGPGSVVESLASLRLATPESAVGTAGLDEAEPAGPDDVAP